MSHHDSKLELGDKLIAVTVCSILHDIRVDVRQLYITADGLERPSQRGISISAQYVDRLIHALEIARDGMIVDGYLIPRESFERKEEEGIITESGSKSGSNGSNVVSRLAVEYDVERAVYPMSRW